MKNTYISKPIEIDAFLLHDPDTMDPRTAVTHDAALNDFMNGAQWFPEFRGIYIKNKTGDIFAVHGDYIVKGDNEEFTVFKPDEFKETYDLVGPEL